jgi:hypothetical protein
MIYSSENFEPLLESLGYNLNEIIGFDESDGLDNGLEFNEEIDAAENRDNEDIVINEDILRASQKLQLHH